MLKVFLNRIKKYEYSSKKNTYFYSLESVVHTPCRQNRNCKVTGVLLTQYITVPETGTHFLTSISWHSLEFVRLVKQLRLGSKLFKEIGLDTLSFRSNPALAQSTALHSLPLSTLSHIHIRKKKLYVGSQREQGCHLVPNLFSAAIDSQNFTLSLPSVATLRRLPWLPGAILEGNEGLIVNKKWRILS